MDRDRDVDLPVDLATADLGELHGLNQFYRRNAEEETKAAKRKGGPGTNRVDDSARDFSRKQVAVNSEIQDRLLEVHNSRSKRAQAMDESLRAERADDPVTWSQNPARWDWPGIDTPR